MANRTLLAKALRMLVLAEKMGAPTWGTDYRTLRREPQLRFTLTEVNDLLSGKTPMLLAA